VERECHVVSYQLEVFAIEEMLDIFLRPREQIIDADNIGALRQQAFAKVRAEEASTASNQNASL
jgi:hypothetical protein